MTYRGKPEPRVIPIVVGLGLVLLLVVAGVSSAGIADFGKRKTAPSGLNPQSMVTADLNRDGRTDAVVPSFDDVTLTVLRGRGKRAMKRVATIALPGQPDQMVAARVDGDKNLDLVVGGLTEGVMVLRGKKGMGFKPVQLIPDAFWPRNVAVGDFNKDGRTDIAAGRQQSDQTVIYLQNAAGGFDLGAAVAPHGAGLAATDLDADGKKDLVGYDWAGSELFVRLGKGDGTFDIGTPVPVSGGVSRVMSLDLNRDGDRDIAALRSVSDPPGPNDIFYLRGKGDGTFRTPRMFETGTQGVGTNYGDRPGGVAFGKLNGDKHIDAAVTIEQSAAGNQNKVAILRGKPGGRLGQPTMIGGGPGPEQVAIARMNGDALGDLLIAGGTPSKGILSLRLHK